MRLDEAKSDDGEREMNASSDVAPGAARTGLLSLRIGVIVCLLAGLLIWAARHASEQVFGVSTLYAALLALPVSAASIVLAAWRLRIISHGRVDLFSGIKATALVATVMILLPSRLSDFFKPAYLRQRIGFPLADGLAALFFERMFDIFAVAGLLALTGVLTTTVYVEQFDRATTVMFATALVIAFGVAVAYRFPDRFEALLAYLPILALRQFSLRLLQIVRQTSNRRTLVWGALSSIAVWLSSWLTFAAYCYGLAQFGGFPALSPAAVLLVFMAGTLGLVLTVTPGGVGTFEFAIALALTLHGVSLNDGLLHAFVLRVVVVLPNLLITLGMLWRDDFRLKALLDQQQAPLTRVRQAR